MKAKMKLWTALWVLCAVAVSGWSQPDPGPPPFEGQPTPTDPPPGEFEAPPRFGDNPQGGPPGSRMEGRRSSQLLERWLEHMRRANPEEFERLMNVREEDPEAFRRALRARRDQLREEGQPDRFQDGPRMQRFNTDTPPGERRRDMDESGQDRHRGWQRQPDDPDIQALERKTRDLVERYREAPEEERTALRNQLREQLVKLFGLREKQRRRQIERMARKLEDLQRALEERAAQRDEIVARRLEELLGEDPLGW